ncbi:MAG: hypothetical protein M5R36_11950 [Deltaproteobacteria bacterium]|nr:hypothetical protein [Deltaproteobacteria bacterium]
MTPVVVKPSRGIVRLDGEDVPHIAAHDVSPIGQDCIVDLKRSDTGWDKEYLDCGYTGTVRGFEFDASGRKHVLGGWLNYYAD